MGSSFLHIVVLVWVGVHPVRYELPKLYPATDAEQCNLDADQLFKQRKTKTYRKLELFCEETPLRKL
jgi:hypothetical protein